MERLFYLIPIVLIIVLLFAVCRSLPRVVRLILPLAAAVLGVTAGLTLFGQSLILLHLVGPAPCDPRRTGQHGVDHDRQVATGRRVDVGHPLPKYVKSLRLLAPMLPAPNNLPALLRKTLDGSWNHYK